MRIAEAFEGVTRVFLDTAPVIYFVEATPVFAEVTWATFELMEQRGIQGVTTPVTLAECLVMPIRLGLEKVQQDFTDLLMRTDGIELVDINAVMGQKAAELRERYGLKLPDALQLAAALEAGCEIFLTNDVVLQRVTELRVWSLVMLEI
ncbi:MAG: type II toxin-antitoxin system VapC family toxin [Xenococcaceae cyanobacterium]